MLSRLGVPLGKCYFFRDIGPNLENIFIIYLQAQGNPQIPLNFSKLWCWQSYYTFKGHSR